MGSKVMATRIKLLEFRIGVSKEPLPTIFLGVVDSSMPDPDDPRVEVEYSDATTTAVSTTGSPPNVVPRLPGESVEQLKDRAGKLFPECRVFWTVYEGGLG